MQLLNSYKKNHKADKRKINKNLKKKYIIIYYIIYENLMCKLITKTAHWSINGGSIVNIFQVIVVSFCIPCVPVPQMTPLCIYIGILFYFIQFKNIIFCVLCKY